MITKAFFMANTIVDANRGDIWDIKNLKFAEVNLEFSIA